MNGFWDHEDEALFIEMIRQYPPLWNTADKNYPKKGLKRLLYMQIAEELKKRWPDKAHMLTAAFLKKKFNSLRSYFLREQKKMKLCDNMSTVRKWIHFEKMLSLTEKGGINNSECDLNLSIERVEGETTNGDNEMEHSDSVAKTSCFDSNEGEDSSLSSQLFLQSSEEAAELPLKREKQDDLPLMCDSVVTETPANSIVIETNCSNGNVGSDSTLLQSNEDVEPSVKIEVPDDSSPTCVSFETKTPVNTIVAETNCSNKNKGSDSFISLLPSVPSNEEAAELPSKKKKLLLLRHKTFPFNRNKLSNSSLMCDSIETETPVILKAQSASVQLPHAFNIGSRYLLVRRLNQASIEKAKKTTEERQLNKKATKPFLKRKKQIISTPVHDSFDTETPGTAAVAETSCPDSSEITDSFLSLQPPEQLNEEATKLPLKRKKLSNSSTLCDSIEVSSASSQMSPNFNVAFGNLVAASLNQMPKEKANAATKEIFEVLLKYGRETNHLR